jgi:homoserine O-acetyltransferase/O-succinyltransferase
VRAKTADSSAQTSFPGGNLFEDDFYSQALQGPYESFNIGDLVLEAGETLRQCRLAYATFGTLNEHKSNVILVTTWFAGTHKIIEQVYIGADRALDPAKYFIVVVNQIGGGLSTSPHNTAFPIGAGNFPAISIGDDVVAQERLLRQKFGIEKLALVTGGSMGAQQVYEWAVRFPTKVERAAPIAGTARTTPHDWLFVETLIEAITSDPAWDSGWYSESRAVHKGLSRHALQWALMGLSAEFLRAEEWRGVGFSSLEDFLKNFFYASFLPMDPNNLLCMARKWQRADVSRHAGGDLALALDRVKARTVVMPIVSDMFFVTADCAAEQVLVPGSSLKILDTAWGHVGLYGLDPGYLHQVDGVLGDLLAQAV